MRAIAYKRGNDYFIVNCLNFFLEGHNLDMDECYEIDYQDMLINKVISIKESDFNSIRNSQREKYKA